VAAQLPPETKVEKAREVFMVTNGEAIRRGMYQQSVILVTMQYAQVQSPVPSEEFSAQILQILREELDRAVDQNLPMLADQVAVIFAETFTEEELDTALNNSNGPAVESMHAKIPTIAEETIKLIRAWNEPVILGVVEAVDQRLREKGLVQ